jgi:hypothetical protein
MATIQWTIKTKIQKHLLIRNSQYRIIPRFKLARNGISIYFSDYTTLLTLTLALSRY